MRSWSSPRRARVDDRAPVESVSFAFLLALEALSPAQRAVLLLRDVFEYTGAEAAAALDLSEANVRVLLHRARRALADYDAKRVPRDASSRERSLEVLGRFMAAFAKQDVPGMEALLAEGVVTLNDTNGRYPAAGVAVVGRNKVARFHAGIARLREGETPRIQIRSLNGTVSIYVEFDPQPEPACAALRDDRRPRRERARAPDLQRARARSSSGSAHGYRISRVTASQAARVSAVSLVPAALRESSSCATDVAPMMVEPT
jgi:hypothetical protein